MITSDSKLVDTLEKTIARLIHGEHAHSHKQRKARVITSIRFRAYGGPRWRKALIRFGVLHYSSHRIRRTLLRRHIVVSRSNQYGITTRRELVRYEPLPMFDRDSSTVPIEITDAFGRIVQLSGCWSLVDKTSLSNQELEDICKDFEKI